MSRPCSEASGGGRRRLQASQPEHCGSKSSVSHLAKGQIVERLAHRRPDGRIVSRMEDMEFFRRQTKIVLGRCGRVDPQNIDDTLVEDGYRALAGVLRANDPEAVLREMKVSGLRGRGGAGFPTWRKWSFARNAPGSQKFVVCNADEGDPGAFMDRSIIEGDPHAVIEGMAIAAFTIGAAQGYVYIRAEYPLAVGRLKVALAQARQRGLLGKNILGAGFDFELEIRMGAGAFVCGEETALLTSIEGNRGEPRPRPPFPALSGLWGKPTLLNNVETYANVPSILLRGGQWYASHGGGRNKGPRSSRSPARSKAPGWSVPVECPWAFDLRYRRDLVGQEFKAARSAAPPAAACKQHLNVPWTMNRSRTRRDHGLRRPDRDGRG